MLVSMLRPLLAVTLLLGACAEEAVAPPPSESPTPGPSPTESPFVELTPPGEEECVDATVTGRPEVTIRQVDDAFSPACLTVLGGQGIKLANRGASVHNFSIEGSDVDIDTPPGETVKTRAIGGVVEPGTHTFYCEYHRSRGMEGEITITEAG